MIQVVPLLLAAAVVGSLHISAPDHWVTLVVMANTSNWSQSKLLRIALIAGLGHVALSIFLGFLM